DEDVRPRLQRAASAHRRAAAVAGRVRGVVRGGGNVTETDPVAGTRPVAELAEASTGPSTGSGAGGSTPPAPTGTQSMPFSRALNTGLRAALANSDRVLLMGEDIGRLGGVFRVTEGLQAEFGDRRVLDTPLAESGIVGTAIGLAMVGFRPVIEIQFDGFVFPAFDQ